MHSDEQKVIHRSLPALIHTDQADKWIFDLDVSSNLVYFFKSFEVTIIKSDRKDDHCKGSIMTYSEPNERTLQYSIVIFEKHEHILSTEV